MSNKTKFILIALESGVLFVLLLLGVGCQQRWIIVTGDGPRFDWYAVKEDLDISDIKDAKDSEESEAAEQEEPEESGSSNAVVTPPADPEPETTEPEETEETPETTEEVTTILKEDWETDEF